MKKTKTVITLLLCLSMLCPLAAALTGCEQVRATDLTADIEANEVTGKDADAVFIDAGTSFALSLFQETVRQEEEQRNVLLSPLSVWLALSMTANGASGETRAQMERLLGGDIPLETLNEYLYSYVKNLPSDEKYKVTIADSIWIREEFDQVRPEFLQTNADYYGAAAYRAPFDRGTVRAINDWVKDNTDGMIDKMVEEISDDTVMYLLNALVFDAEWADIYAEEQIRDGVFTDAGGETSQVKMMYSTERKYLDDGRATGFVKGYRHYQYSFAALLPNEGTDIYEYIASLSAEGLHKTLDQATFDTVHAAMPQFESDYAKELNDVFIALGMRDAFSRKDADFTRMASGLYIAKILHKTHITVDERGTKAGAATMVEMDLGGIYGPEDPKTVVLDRPFVYMILDNSTNLPIFIGAVVDL